MERRETLEAPVVLEALVAPVVLEDLEGLEDLQLQEIHL